MIKFVKKQGNISLAASVGYSQAELNEALEAQEKRIEKEHVEYLTELQSEHMAEVNGLNTVIGELEEDIDILIEQVSNIPPNVEGVRY